MPSRSHRRSGAKGGRVLIKGLVTVLAIDFIFVVLSIPLILRKVPRNVVYGFRTCATLADDFVWFETNAYFGRGLVVSSIVSAAMVFLLFEVPDVSQRFFFVSTIGALVVPPLVATFLTLRFARSLTPGGPTNMPAATAPR
jgi:hypothetical protein